MDAIYSFIDWLVASAFRLTPWLLAPLIVASGLAPGAKAIIRTASMDEPTRNRLMTIAGVVRGAGLAVVLFFFFSVFWMLSAGSRL
jgi:hypothetical protein